MVIAGIINAKLPRMFVYPKINPIALSLGPIKVHWYGVMYLLAFLIAWWLGKKRALKPDSGWNPEQVSDLIFYGALGVVLGGRIGYTLFYNFPNFINDPSVVFKIWLGGMSFHGGLLGVLIAIYFFCRKYKKSFFQTVDFVAPLVPLGYFFGRIGNFINGELWGRVTDVPWAMIFPQVDNLPRHPSMLYQGVTEGLGIFVIVWLYSNKPRPTMAVSGLFAICFGVFRFINEFFRQPDPQLGFVAFGWMSMGQILSIPLAIAGLVLMWLAYRNEAKKTSSQEVK